MQMNFLSVENSQFIADYSWNCGGKLFTFDTPKVMAIVNCTPDSFLSQSRVLTETEIATLIDKYIAEGADILDIGGFSTRPGSSDVDLQTEWSRIAVALRYAKSTYPDIPVSIDTFRAEIAHRACLEGANIINDISAGELDKEMFREVAFQKVPIILMHMRGSATHMMDDTNYENLTAEVIQKLSERIAKAREYGILDIAVDPGFGFSKTLEQNYELLKNMEHMHLLEAPVLAGFSRKSMINKILHTTANEALNGTTVLNTIALQKGAHILRVHDVKEAKEAVKLVQSLNKF